MNIITLTLNPAFDMHCRADGFMPYKECLATVISHDAGGKGVNISRALSQNGVENLALVVLGDENGDAFGGKLVSYGIRFLPLHRPGRIRENITLHTEGKGETRISFPGFPTDEGLLLEAEDAIAPYLARSILTFTGRVPSGIGMAEVKAFLQRAKAKGARLVINSHSFSRGDLIEMRPWLVKPNEEEVAEYAEGRVETHADAVLAAKELFDAGIENVMISLGGRGAVLVSAEGAYAAVPPAISPVSTIGAGDSAIAGFLAAAVRGEGKEACLRTAVSYGTAACLTEGTTPPARDVVEEIAPKIEIVKM